MTDTEINIAIAEACGWTAKHWSERCDGVKRIKCGACGAMGHGNCYGSGLGPIDVLCADNPCCEDAAPKDYCHDLNAMHEAEEHLNTALMEPTIYCNELLAIVGEAVSVTNPMAGCYFHIHATARQRAEAFLRTIGKWKE